MPLELAVGVKSAAIKSISCNCAKLATPTVLENTQGNTCCVNRVARHGQRTTEQKGIRKYPPGMQAKERQHVVYPHIINGSNILNAINFPH
jgi:hypothetical protein